MKNIACAVNHNGAVKSFSSKSDVLEYLDHKDMNGDFSRIAYTKINGFDHSITFDGHALTFGKSGGVKSLNAPAWDAAD